VKLLFDENLSARLVELLAAEFPGSTHVERVLGRGRPDAELWEYAIANGYAIVSKDNDFRQRAFMSSPPPKVFWLDIGNAGTEQISELLKSRVEEVNRFGESPQESLLVLHN
jgi:predicted nuclease of predicted toxin-antitoxin system